MRPVNEERVVVEYIRIHRIVDQGQITASQVEGFGPDLLERLQAGVDLSGRWWKRSWRIGNVESASDAAGDLVRLSFQFGWFGEAPTHDAPPPYDEAEHRWTAEPASRREGALALIAVDAASQVAGVTSLAGDPQVPGLTRALTDVLNQAEMQAQQSQGGRTSREWMVDVIDERGTFESWVSTVAKVTRVSARFHLPNPRSGDDLDPVVNFLRELSAADGGVSASNSDGLDPYGHPLMRSAVAMQENDYGSITARGENQEGDPEAFSSREHPVRDVYTLSEQNETELSVRGVLGVIFRLIAQKLEQGLR